MNLKLNTIHNESCLTGLPKLREKIFHTAVTSPPYYGLRDYGLEDEDWPEMEYSMLGAPVKVEAWKGQLGLEPTPHMFVGHIVTLFREVYRVLRDDGTLWLNFGDSYAGGGRAGYNPDNYGKHKMFGKTGWNQSVFGKWQKVPPGLKSKDLIGIPWMVAFALRDDGWFLRQDIIWSKLTAMPESVTDRCTKSHEYLFLFSKAERYFYDHEAIKTESSWSLDDYGKYAWGRAIDGSIDDVRKGNGSDIRKEKRKSGNKERKSAKSRGVPTDNDSTHGDVAGSIPWEGSRANKRSVWRIGPEPCPEAHFATFPQALIIDPIKAGCPEFSCPVCGGPWLRVVEKELVPTGKAAKTAVIDKRDIEADKGDQGSNRQKDGHISGWINSTQTVAYEMSCKCKYYKPVPGITLDPFSGYGTSYIVSRKLHRNFIGYEVNEEYHKLAQKRIYEELGIFK